MWLGQDRAHAVPLQHDHVRGVPALCFGLWKVAAASAHARAYGAAGAKPWLDAGGGRVPGWGGGRRQDGWWLVMDSWEDY